MSAIPATERLKCARTAQAMWAKRPLAERVRVLATLRRQIAASRETLITAIVSDTGKPPLDALAGDVLVTLEQMLYYEKHARRLLAPRHVARDPFFFSRTRFTEYREPHGVALIFAPANYPLQLGLIPAITALYAGNAVILKVSERTPLFAQALAHIVARSSLSSDLLQVTYEEPAAATALIDAAPDILFFTGNSGNGRAVAARASALSIPCVLELGGKDPALVFADCNFQRTVEGVTYGAFSNSGQVCVAVKRLLLERPIYSHFVEALVRRASILRVGSGEEDDLGYLAGDVTLLAAQVQDALARGAKLLLGSVDDVSRPIILSDVPPDARLLHEESFGPVLCVQPFESEEEGVALANATPYALGASVWTRNFARGRRVAQAVDAGFCCVNDVIRGAANPHASFGGNRASGYGRYRGPQGLYAFSKIRTVMENRSAGSREVSWFPFSHKTYLSLDAVIELRHRPRGIVHALRRFFHLALVVVWLGACSLAHAASAHLLLKVMLPAAAHGRIAYLVFRSATGFPGDESLAIIHGFSQPVHGGSEQTIDVGSLPPGRYAVSVYLDENGNGKLDTGMLGIPREPVGVSNNPRHRMGPPRFSDAAFEMGGSTQTLTINLVRP